MESVPQSVGNSIGPYLDENAERFVPRPSAVPAPDARDFRSNMEVLARELGLLRIGFASAEPFHAAGQRFKEWLGQGHAGTMSYLAELGDRHIPGRLLANARSLVVVAAAVPAAAGDEDAPFDATREATRGKVADYALGLDYHIALRSRMRGVAQGLADWSGETVWTRACIDTAPLLEREAARRAGIGFIAKSTMLIVPGVGPRVLLGTMVTDLALPAAEAIESRCGRCTACLDACPTRAFVGPYELDARKCLSYLTIEHQGEFPAEHRSAMGNRVIGCDVCQTVCPYDRIGAVPVMTSDATPRPQLQNPDLRRWLAMTSTDYRRITKRTALRRVTRVQLMRNAAIALGNCASPAALPELALALASNQSAAVRAHAAWALGKLGGTDSIDCLREALNRETEDMARNEIRLALEQLEPYPPEALCPQLTASASLLDEGGFAEKCAPTTQA